MSKFHPGKKQPMDVPLLAGGKLCVVFLGVADVAVRDLAAAAAAGVDLRRLLAGRPEKFTMAF